MGGFTATNNVCVNNANNLVFKHSTGCFSVGGSGPRAFVASQVATFADNRTVSFSASSSNNIYGNSDTVQPPARIVNVWKRVS